MKRNKLEKSMIVGMFIFALCLFTGGPRAQEKIPLPTEKRDVQKAWDALIRMKGGREKLYSLTNVLKEFDHAASLYIFPSNKWSFAYFPVTDDPGVEIFDGEKSVEYYVGKRGLTNSRRMTDRTWIAYAFLPFVLETKWDKPELLRVYQRKQGKNKLDVIEAIVEGKRLDFVYEPEEMLVTEVRYYDSKGEWSSTYAMSNYTEINGIKMPQLWAPIYDDPNRKKIDYIPIKFAFNVDFDPKIFEPPFNATTADAWKRKP